MLTPLYPHLWQFISYAFLHGSILHIVGNMFFLYLFGNNVNDKLGHIGYLCFYLAGAVFSAIGHTLVSTVPVLGASGAIAAVTGAYLVLFPQSLIEVFFWLLWYIDTFDIPALYFIGFKLIFWDNVLERSIPNVAYEAHLAGYTFGIAAMLIMLATGLLAGTSFDLWSMIKQWNRRRQYRDVVAEGFNPFTGHAPTRQIKVKDVTKPVDKQKLQKIEQLRSDIAARMLQRNLSAAAEKYLELIAVDSDQLLPRQYLLDIANQLASESKHADAAKAYEQFLAHYGNFEYIEQVQLMLGLLYSRYLGQPRLAKKHLSAAVSKLSDAGQLKMCRAELENLQNI
jgi:membrane associated rhomboid family serine protease